MRSRPARALGRADGRTGRRRRRDGAVEEDPGLRRQRRVRLLEDRRGRREEGPGRTAEVHLAVQVPGTGRGRGAAARDGGPGGRRRRRHHGERGRPEEPDRRAEQGRGADAAVHDRLRCAEVQARGLHRFVERRPRQGRRQADAQGAAATAASASASSGCPAPTTRASASRASRRRSRARRWS